MKTVLTLAVGAVVGALIAVVLMLTLDEDNEARAGSVNPDELTSADCLELIPDSVFETLGWQLGGMASEHVGRCEKFGDDGNITVGALANQEYDELCTGLFESGSGTPDVDIDWLPEGTTACARLLEPGRDTGLAELFLLTDSDEVVQIRLGALTSTDEGLVQEACAQLVELAQAQW